MTTTTDASVATLMPVRQLPWAGISTGTADDSEALTSTQLLKKAGLDWDVAVRPLHRRLADGTYEPSARTFETYRTDTEDQIGAVKKRYVPVMNRQMFAFGDSLVESGLGKWVHGGMQGNGYRVFMTMLLNEEFTVLGTDTFKTYLFLVGSHDGSKSVTAFNTPVRGFCTNQLNVIRRSNYGQYKIQHSGDVAGKLEAAAVAIGEANAYAAELKGMAEQLATVKLTDEKSRYLVTSIIPERRSRREEMVEEILVNAKTSPTVAGYEGTGWGLLNGLTEYMDHIKPQRSGNARFESITFGEGAKMRVKLTEALAELN